MRTGVVSLLVMGLTAPTLVLGANLPQQEQQPVFRAAVERVALAVSVRTRQGKPVTSLSHQDFQLFDSGERRSIEDFRTEESPVSLGLLVDFSGSMDVAARREAAKANTFQLLSWLRPGIDQAGLYIFDKELRQIQKLAPAPGDIIAQLDSVRRPFGATSLFDAIAETGRVLSEQGGARRAVVAITDGGDNSSALTPTEVSTIASGIDVPVYIVIVVSPFDRSGRSTTIDERLEAVRQGPLGNLARWTGGDIFIGVNPSQSTQAARQIVTELRQQYLISFAADSRPGWHPIDVRTRDKNLVVRARSGYVVRNRPALETAGLERVR